MNSGIISESALDVLERLVEIRKFTKIRSKPYGATAAALSRPPRVTLGDPPHRPSKQRREPKGEP